MNPYYQYSGYQWPGWGLGANRGGIMQKLNRGGDFLEDLMAQEMAQEEDPLMMGGNDKEPVEEALDYEEIGEGAVNVPDPRMAALAVFKLFPSVQAVPLYSSESAVLGGE